MEEADSGGDERGNYVIPTETNLKQYYIEEENYEGTFGPGKVIAPMEGISGKNRFYVMALEDIDENTHTWWANAQGHLDSAYIINSSVNDFAEDGAEPTGLVNTKRMMECYENQEINGVTVEHGTNDMWGYIKEQVEDGWFVPSKSEWEAFGIVFGENFDNYGLNDWYWSSSQYNTSYLYYANFYDGYININYVGNNRYVRLSTTF